MLNPNLNGSIYVASQTVDMRKGFVGLSAYIQSVLKENPMNGAWFVFFGRRHDRVKIFYYDEVGLCVWYKLLPKGVFRPPKVDSESYELSHHELSLLLSGIELTNKDRFSKVTPGLIE